MQIAQFSAELEQYPQAVAIYEDVARSSVENNLLKYSAKGYLLNAGICCLCCEWTEKWICLCTALHAFVHVAAVFMR